MYLSRPPHLWYNTHCTRNIVTKQLQYCFVNYFHNIFGTMVQIFLQCGAIGIDRSSKQHTPGARSNPRSRLLLTIKLPLVDLCGSASAGPIRGGRRTPAITSDFKSLRGSSRAEGAGRVSDVKTGRLLAGLKTI